MRKSGFLRFSGWAENTLSSGALVTLDSKAGKKQLAKLEKRIEANTKAAWKENGLMMLYIRDSGIYKFEYGTFKNYLNVYWKIDESRGYRLLDGIEFVRKLEHCSKNESVKNSPTGEFSAINLPANEWQIRPLVNGLKNDSERMHVWGEVVKQATQDAANAPVKPGSKKPVKPQDMITANLVQSEVDKFKASGVVVPDVVIELPEVTDKDLLSDTEQALLALLGDKPK